MIMVFVDMQVEGGLWAKQDTRNKTCGPQRKKEQRPHDSKSVQGSEEERLRAKGGEGGRGRGRGGGGRGEERLAGGGPQRMAVSVTLGRQKKGRGKGECVGDRHAGAQRSPWAAAGVPAGEERQIMGLGRG